jgi:four helix bundle protein
VNHKAEELKARTAAFAKTVIELCDRIPQTIAGRTIARQLVEAATAVNANYRAACRARSRAEFVAKLGTVREEADECCGWLDLLVASNLLTHAATATVRQEADELTAIFTASLKTAGSRSRQSRTEPSRNPPPTPQSSIPE